MRLAFGVLLAVSLLSRAATAETQKEAEALCAKAAKNAAIYELVLDKSEAQPLAAPGRVQCRWTFAKPAADKAEFVVDLRTEMLRSEAVAKLSVDTARLPENRKGRLIEPLPKMGDGGNMFTTVDQSVLKLIEIDAVKGRQRYLLTVRPTTPSGLNYRVPGQTLSFFGIGLGQL